MSEPTALRFRLSPQQRRLWLLREANPGAPFHAAAAVSLAGPLDADRLERALAAVVERHEILRTRFVFLPAMRLPVQEVADDGAPALAREEWSEAGEAEIRERAEAWRAEAGRAPLRAEGGPLVDALLARTGPDRHLLLLSLPALLADAASLPVLVRDLARAYAGDDGGAPAVQYADVAEVLNDLVESEGTAAGRDVWRRREEGAPGEPRLAAVRADGGAFAPGRISRALPAGAVEGTRALAERLGVGADAVLLACWQALLARLAGEPALTLGAACDGRLYEGLDRAIGPFARTLPLAGRVDGVRPFSALCADAAAAAAELHEWQDYFYQEPAGAPPRPGFYAAGFEWRTRPAPEPAGDVRFALDDVHACGDRFSLRLCCVAGEGETRLDFEHDAGSIDADEVERIAARFLVLVESALAAPDAPVAALDLLPQDERARVLADLTGPSADWDAGLTLHAAFERQAARTPARPAVVLGERALTFAELDARANQVAHALRADGVVAEDRVGVLLERSPEQLVAILGVLKAGGAYVPLDPAYPAERLAHAAAASGLRALVTQASLAHRLPGAPATLRLDADAARLDALPAESPRVPVSPEGLAYVIHTSGSTGRPKGVMVQHRSAVHLAEALARAVYAGREAPLRVAMNAPAAFDASVKQWIQLVNGHTIRIVPEEDRLDARRLAARVGEWGIDVLDCTPTQLRALLAAGLGGEGAPSPSIILVGGEAVDPALWSRLGDLPNTAVFNVYGPTEATVDATAGRVAGSEPALGRALPNVALRLLDDALRPVPVGAAGELCIAGPGVARGYLGEPARTAERFVPDPFGAPGGRMYRSGDRARLWADGRLEYLGRADDQVKVRGVRLELGEVEAVLMEHPGVAAAAAAVRDLGRGDPELVAWCAPRPGVDGEGLPAELRATLRARLPEFLVPSLVAIVPALPRTPGGKVDRRALPDPRPLAAAPAAAHVAPRGEVEQALAGIWRDVLGVERVGIHDRFFDLGGNSLLIVQVYDRVTARLGERISLVELFQYPTIAALAERLGEGGAAAGAAAAPSAVVDEAEARAARQREAMEARRPLAPAGEA
ncbi:MAG TPA: amino acid adenylation domain-containing protein [Longimicrobium sp.]|nr:amino acid adenylation domain-containing protein [Longimicrobium sp.]